MQLVLRMLALGVAMQGEPWRGYFDPQALGQALHAMGYRKVTDWDCERINRSYFRTRRDGLGVGGGGHLLCATL